LHDTGVPAQAPALQVSAVVHALPSSQDPLRGAYEHTPPLHAPADA
jgi:hypothetical protein